VETYIILLIVICIVLLVLFLVFYIANQKKSKKLDSLAEQIAIYSEKLESLRKYQQIIDAEGEAKKIINQAKAIALKIRSEAKETESKSKHLFARTKQKYNQIIAKATELANSKLKESRQKAKTIREKAEKILNEAHTLAGIIEKDAKARAEKIAGDAWKAKENADHYDATVKAMKNIIKGYGDEYLVPNEDVLDELSQEYDHKEAGRELARVRALVKSMIKNDEAADCDYVEPYRRRTAIEFVLDAFNGKIDSIMAKVKHDNYGKLKQKIEDSYRLVNHNGKAFRNARITLAYLDAVKEQLKFAVATQELKRIDQEEQRQIKAQMREEAKVQREAEKIRRQAEKEERMVRKAMAQAEKRLAAAADQERLALEEEIAKLKDQLLEAEAKGERAISMAQQTKQGHIYIISNPGSFGEEVIKIGMTRRLEPMDRVKELGDASVPFMFDVHAIIHSDDAPSLENELHQCFHNTRVNKVNIRKEFFRAPLTKIKGRVTELGYEAHWTMKAEALEYRESLQIEKHSIEESKNKDAQEANLESNSSHVSAI
jgi:hypothetical protein